MRCHKIFITIKMKFLNKIKNKYSELINKLSQSKEKYNTNPFLEQSIFFANKTINKIKRNYSELIYNFSQKEEKYNAYSTLEQSKFIANKIIWAICATSGLGLILLIFAKTDQIIIVDGELQPTTRVREIKIPISGVVEKVFINEGDYVEENQKLLLLDDFLIRENNNNLIKKINLKENELIFKNNELINSIDILNNQITNLTKVIKIEENNLERFKSLKEQGALSKYEYDNQKIKILNFRSELISKKSSLKVTENELKQEIKFIENNILDFKNEKEIVKEKLKYSEISSPINGYVFELKAKDIGYIINTNEEIMKIVPKNDLEGVIYISSEDIGFVKLGQNTELNIESYPSTDFGILKGSISFISSNSSKINQNDNRLFYKARINLDNQSFETINGKNLDLKPGMSLKANIKLRKLSYLQLIFNTFSDKTKSIKQM